MWEVENTPKWLKDHEGIGHRGDSRARRASRERGEGASGRRRARNKKAKGRMLCDRGQDLKSTRVIQPLTGDLFEKEFCTLARYGG